MTKRHRKGRYTVQAAQTHTNTPALPISPDGLQGTGRRPLQSGQPRAITLTSLEHKEP
ncbi:MAG: hypothetical protein KA773_19065 [Chloroflexi bacterium]|nr:hypothetical protein [Chloroflexota bacterium]